MDYNKLSHVVWDCKCHTVILPKYRCKIFTKDIKEALRDEIKKLCNRLRIVIIEVLVCKDHIHLFLVIPPKYSLSDVVGKLKSKAAIRMFNS